MLLMQDMSSQPNDKPFDDANCAAVGTSPDQDLDWSTADSLERDIITMSHLAHIEGSLW